MYNGQQGIQDEHKGEWLEQERVGSHQSPRDRTRRMGGPGRGLEGEERGGAGHRRGDHKGRADRQQDTQREKAVETTGRV